MNLTHALPRAVDAFLIGCLCVLPFTSLALAAENSSRSAAETLQAIQDREALKPVGAVSEKESSDLLAVLESTNQVDWIAEVESFVQANPQSRWVPSVRGMLAQKNLETARFTPALEHFEAAWLATKNASGGEAKEIADEALARYAELLTRLGRVDHLEQLFKETQGRKLSSDYLNWKLSTAKEAYAMMATYPELAYRCGTFALRAVGKKVALGKNLEALVDAASPKVGFSLANLADFSEENGLNLVAVKRSAGDELIVPSVVHWKQNHYAAILEETNGQYLVEDPTFEMQKWVPKAVVNNEASGYFLVPKKSKTAAWQEIDRAESSQVRGRGYPNNIRDRFDEGCKKAPGASECTPCAGMPMWWVSEPYINLWMADEPLSYRTSGGEDVKFRLTYNQRDTRPTSGSNNRVRPTTWNHNWFSYVQLRNHSIYTGPFDPDQTGPYSFQFWHATLYVPGGGERDYAYTSHSHPNAMNDEGSRTRLEPLDGTGSTVDTGTGDTVAGLRLIHPDGSFDIYGYVLNAKNLADGLIPETQALLSLSIDRFGNTNRFYYEQETGASTRYRLKYFVDYDDRTNTLSYNASNRVSQVQDPYGRTAQFNYDTNNRLTNIVDAVGLQSFMEYDSDGAITKLTTPYGVTSFAHVNAATNDGQGNLGGHDRVARSVRVSEANGSKQLFLYRFDSTSFMVSTNTNGVPVNTPLGTIDTGDSGTNTFKSVAFRNSFHWGRKQYGNLSTENFTNFTADDYLLARMRHWLQDEDDLYVCDALSIERDPSPDGTTEGLKTFYDYPDKPFGCRLGTNSVAQVMARLRPDNQTEYVWTRLNKDGYPTNIVSTYATASGTVGARTNVFVFGTNVTQYVWISGVNTTAVKFSTNYNLLLRVLDASNQVVASFADYLSNTTKRVFYGYTPTAIVYTTSQQIFPSYATNGVGDVTSYLYSPRKRLASIKSPSGLTTTNIYADGFLTQTVDLEINRTNSFTYSGGLLNTHTDARGLTTTHTWDNLLRLTRMEFSDSTFISNRYDRLDLGGQRDRLGHWRYFGYNAVRQLVAATNELGNPTQFSYGSCGCGEVEHITNALNQTTTFSYDLQLRPTTTELPDGSQVTRHYDLLGQVTSVEDGASRSATFFYNHQGLRTAVSNAYGQEQRIVFDMLDRPTQVTDAAGVTVTNTFDIIGRPLTRSFPDGGVERFAYGTSGNGRGQLIYHTNQLGAVTQFGYDVAGRRTAITNANLEVTRLVYDASDLRQIIDGNNQTNQLEYDVFGRLTNKVNAAGQSILRLTYDANNRMVSRWTPAKGTTWFTNDDAGNLRVINYPNSTDITLDYDALNRVQQMSDAVGTSAFTYTGAGQLSSEDGPWSNDVLTNIYSQLLRTSSTLGTTWTNTHGYDNARRLNTLVSGAGSFGYEFVAGSGLRKNLTLPNHSAITNAYDLMAQLTNTTLLHSNGGVINSHRDYYNQWGQRYSSKRADDSRVDYAYDAAGQLKAANPYTAGNTLITAQRTSYGFDTAGNLNYRTNDTTIRSFTTDKLNQLSNVTYGGTITVSGVTTTNATNVTVNGVTATLNTNDGTYSVVVPVGNGTNTLTAIGDEKYGRHATSVVAVATASFQYDANGNLLYDGTKGFAYDDENQLATITTTNAWKSEFTYDGFGRRRIRKEFTWSGSAWSQTSETRYVCDGMLAAQERDGNNNAQVNYTRGLDLSGGMQGAGGIGGLLARTDGNGNAYYHADAGGNVTALVNGSQSLVANYRYDPFGNVLSASGSLSAANEMQFSSMPRHSPSALSLYAYRAYSPNLQRWMNADPIGEAGGINLHQFVGNSPVSVIDPFGQDFRVVRGSGGLNPNGPLGYLTGDSALENLGSGAYNVVPLVGNTLSTFGDSVLAVLGMIGEVLEAAETATVGKDGTMALGPYGGSEFKGVVTGLKFAGTLAAVSRVKCVSKELASAKSAVVFRELSAADRARLDSGLGLLPKGTAGDIVDQVAGKTTKYISASETVAGTARYKGGNGLIAIDVSLAIKGGAGYVPHNNVIQALQRAGTPENVRNAGRAREVLFRNEIPYQAIQIIK